MKTTDKELFCEVGKDPICVFLEGRIKVLYWTMGNVFYDGHIICTIYTVDKYIVSEKRKESVLGMVCIYIEISYSL